MKNHDKIELDLHFIQEELNKLEIMLIKGKINEKHHYNGWIKDFKKIYNLKTTELPLYIISALLYFIGRGFFLRYLLERDDLTIFNKDSLKFQEVILKEFEEKKIEPKFLELDYFIPFQAILMKNNSIEAFLQLIDSIFIHLSNLQIEPEYYFDYLIQNMISPLIRHGSGEYFTPPFLVKKMVEKSYAFGNKVIDPCCGSGNFLIEIIKQVIKSKKSINEKINAINKIFGCDINPISIFLTRITILYLVRNYLDKITINLHVLDTLFQVEPLPKNQFDLVIGNPPWYTYRDMQSSEYQERVKELAQELEIKPLPKNILNIEIASVFFYRAKDILMKEGSEIFFVMTKGVINGSHASRFRNFKGFIDVNLWFFEKKIESVFNMEFICLNAQKGPRKEDNPSQEIPAKWFNTKSDISKFNYFTKLNLELDHKDVLVPYSVEIKGKRRYSKKLITRQASKEVLAGQISPYKKLFHKGADLNPRNLIFVSVENMGDPLLILNPDPRIFKKAKSPWKKIEFTSQTIEKKYLFKVMKSTELLKFYLHDHYDVFLPLEKDDLRFDLETLAPKAKNFYLKINEIYMTLKKSTTKHASLMDNLNRWNKLSNKRQLSHIKVVYNNSGSILSSAVVQGDYIITGDLSFYETDDIDEAHYLTAILNSNILTSQVRIKKSSRHIFKIPFETPIKMFNKQNPNHLNLAGLGKKAQKLVIKNLERIFKENEPKISKMKLQNKLKVILGPILEEIDEIVKKELNE